MTWPILFYFKWIFLFPESKWIYSFFLRFWKFWKMNVTLWILDMFLYTKIPNLEQEFLNEGLNFDQ